MKKLIMGLCLLFAVTTMVSAQTSQKSKTVQTTPKTASGGQKIETKTKSTTASVAPQKMDAAVKPKHKKHHVFHKTKQKTTK